MTLTPTISWHNKIQCAQTGVACFVYEQEGSFEGSRKGGSGLGRVIGRV